MEELRKDLKEELESLLPKNHPFLEKLTSDHDTVDPESIDNESLSYEIEILGRLIAMIDDWKRGIRDWAEVENELIYAREIIVS